MGKVYLNLYESVTYNPKKSSLSVSGRDFANLKFRAL